MKITEVNIAESLDQGLKAIKMSRLNQIVVIAGKNGSGKSRLLSKIKSTLSQKPKEKNIANCKRQLNSHESNLISFNTEYSSLIDDKTPEARKRIENLEDAITSTKDSILRLEGLIYWNDITLYDYSETLSCIDFVPKRLDLQDCNSFNKIQLSANAKQLDTVGLAYAPSGTFAKIQYLQDNWHNATHQNSNINEKRKKEIISSYGNLCEYIKIFLNTNLDRNEEADATLFGFRLGEAKLSDGQKVLLQLCVAIYSQKSKLNEMIFFLDEPENHLHPEALIEVIDKLIDIVKDGQLWIATHSINLLAHVDPSDIWYIEDGLVNYSGNLPNKVLNGLIGDDNEVMKLTNFLSLPAQMANSRFAFECLFEPKTVSNNIKDPQTKQIVDAINILLKKKDKIKVLDFGAGKGRLLSTIKDFNNSNNITINSWLDYYAYDLPSEDEEVCKNIINEVYTAEENRYFNDKESFLETIKSNSFDLIVMCNVFHEINPNDWLDLFNEHNLILSALKKDGTLLIVEDQLIAVGEKAYQNGFIVFDKKQFKKLFKIEDNYVHLDAREDGRLKAHFIPAKTLANIDAASRVKSIECINYTSKEKVQQLRRDKPSYKNGKLHGFWVQQMANSQLVLSELTN